MFIFIFSFLFSINAHDFIMFPGQSFTSYPNATWYVSKWGEDCVVKRFKDPVKCRNFNVTEWICDHRFREVSFAYVITSHGSCPIGEIFSPGKQLPWNPFQPKASPRILMFNPDKNDPFCVSNEEAVQNTVTLNNMMKTLSPGDTLVIAPGSHCMSAGVLGYRLSHVKIDFQGTLWFGQSDEHWPREKQNHFKDAFRLSGATNVTVTSSTREGGLRAAGCIHWYFQRTLQNQDGGNIMLRFTYDRPLLFASSQILVEYIEVQNGPFWQTFYEKVVDVEIHHVRVNIDCSHIHPTNTIKEALDSIAKETDGIDVWGTNVHIHNVEIDNYDDCLCVKGSTDGSGIFSENWLVENSTARGFGLTIGTIMDGDFTVRNVTYRNIYMKDTAIGIYIKVDAGSPNTIEGLLYENVTIDGATLFSPVFIGPVHQFTGGTCDFYWPYFRAGTCSLSGNSNVNVTIKDLTIIREKDNGFPEFGMTLSDFLIVGNDKSKTNVYLSNIQVKANATKPCDDPPLSLSGTCGNACYAANVISDGSINIPCLAASDQKKDGICAPLIGSIQQRCDSGHAKKDISCYSGFRCTNQTISISTKHVRN